MASTATRPKTQRKIRVTTYDGPGAEPVMRALLVTCVAEQQFRRVELFDTVAPRLDAFGEPSRFAF